MDIKSKSIKYSKTLKGFSFVICIMALVTFASSIAYIVINEDYFRSDEYKDSHFYEMEYRNTISELLEIHIDLISEAVIKEKYSSEAEQFRKLRDYEKLKRELKNNKNVIFQLKHLETGEVISNIKDTDPEIFMETQDSFIYYLNDEINDLNGIYISSTARTTLEENRYELRAAVRNPLIKGDILYDNYSIYRIAKDRAQIMFFIAIGGFVAFILSFIYLAMVAGKTSENQIIELKWVDKWFIEFHFIAVLSLMGLSVAVIMVFSEMRDSIFMYTVLGLALVANSIVVVQFCLSLIRQLKAKVIFKNNLIYKGAEIALKGVNKSIKSIGGVIEKLYKKPRLISLFIGYWIINCLLIIGIFNSQEFGSFVLLVILITLNGYVVKKGIKFMDSLNLIVESSTEMVRGNYTFGINQSQISPYLFQLSHNVVNIQESVKQAVEKAIKGEQMKTALITNVSHDLKTPLTSIITYVDLLKNETLNNEKADEYIKVLNDKSYRLKHLIEDIIEVNKASTGNMAVTKEKININELLEHAKGEFDAKIKASTLDFRIQEVKDQMFIEADSNMMWRIIENIFENVIKYAAENSRVYVQIDFEYKQMIVIMKNVSKEPLDISPEQITERFVRGDNSRSTEGSGLGLSIAQSLARIQGGEFEIDIDGDLFKAIIKMPIWDELKNSGIQIDKTIKNDIIA